jgi:hypothetical protein
MPEMRIDYKGKIYGVRRTKEGVQTIIATERHNVLGYIFLSPDNRLKDELNLNNEQFIAVRDAQVFDINGEHLLYETEFMVLNKAIVQWVLPTEALALLPDEPKKTEPAA